MESPVTEPESRSFSSFTSLPTEVRDLIYANVWAPKLRLHAFFKNDRLMTAACLGAQTGDELSGLGDPYLSRFDNHRMPSQEELDLACKLRCREDRLDFMKARLHSTWGNHFRCEEDWNPMPGHITTERNACNSLLLLNKSMQVFYSPHIDVQSEFRTGI